MPAPDSRGPPIHTRSRPDSSTCSPRHPLMRLAMPQTSPHPFLLAKSVRATLTAKQFSRVMEAPARMMDGEPFDERAIPD